MSSIMRGDQTVSLIQLYHAHYPEIARNTQDSEGRNQRVNMWKKIAEELNAQFNTNFTVEQFKKKVQNVQCTSRQKVQNNKRNLGDAEMEYMRLFENDRLKSMDVLPSKFSSYVDDLVSRTSLNNNSLNNNNNAPIVEDFNISAKCKLEQIMDDYGINNNSSNFEVEKQFDVEGQGGDIDEDDVHSRSTPGTSGSGGSTGNGLAGNILGNVGNANNSSNGASLLNNLDQAQQLILAMMANVPSTGNGSNTNNNANGKNINDTLLATINAARRKRVATNANGSNNNNNSFANSNLNNSNNSPNSFNNENINYNNNNNSSSSLPVKRRRKQAHALHLSHLRPTEPFLLESDSMNTTLNNDSLLGSVANLLPTNGADSNKSFGQDNGNGNLGFNSLTNVSNNNVNNNKWRSDVCEMQKNILENQRRILDIIERQTIQQQEDRELRRQRFNSQSPPSPPLNARQQQRPNSSQLLQDSTVSLFLDANDSNTTALTNGRSDTILWKLCEKIGKLSETLSSIDASIKTYFSQKSPLGSDVANSEQDHQKPIATTQAKSDEKEAPKQSQVFSTLEAEAAEPTVESINETANDMISVVETAEQNEIKEKLF